MENIKTSYLTFSEVLMLLGFSMALLESFWFLFIKVFAWKAYQTDCHENELCLGANFSHSFFLTILRLIRKIVLMFALVTII